MKILHIIKLYFSSILQNVSIFIFWGNPIFNHPTYINHDITSGHPTINVGVSHKIKRKTRLDVIIFSINCKWTSTYATTTREELAIFLKSMLFLVDHIRHAIVTILQNVSIIVFWAICIDESTLNRYIPSKNMQHKTWGLSWNKHPDT